MYPLQEGRCLTERDVKSLQQSLPLLRAVSLHTPFSSYLHIEQLLFLNLNRSLIIKVTLVMQ